MKRRDLLKMLPAAAVGAALPLGATSALAKTAPAIGSVTVSLSPALAQAIAMFETNYHHTDVQEWMIARVFELMLQQRVELLGPPPQSRPDGSTELLDEYDTAIQDVYDRTWPERRVARD